MAYRGYKYRIYPNDEARAFFARCFGATRYCYNYCVREYDAALKEGRELSGFDIAARLREHTKDLKWMAGVDYYVKEFAPKRFDNALMKYKRHEANRPHEHKKGERPSVSYTTSGDNIKVDFKHDLVQLPKIGLVRARLHRSFDGEIASATIKREADGKYYISLTVSSEDVAAPMKPHSEAGTVGVDVGLRHLATLSDGTFIDLPDTQRSLARIVFLKKRLSLAKPGSKRYYRTKLQIARLYHHLANVTKDAHRKAAARLCRDYDTICMETLNVKGMRQGKGSNKTAAEVAFNAELHRAALALFHDRVERKAADTGTNFVKIDRWEPSTKRCHVCGHVLDSIDLDTKEWTCPECGTHHDRDVNAAINIRNLGIEKLQERATTRILPPAEGNVKPAKKTTAGCDLRTGKRTVRINRPPKAQIAIGSAPPRIFYLPRIEFPEVFSLLRLHKLVKRKGIPVSALNTWCTNGVENSKQDVFNCFLNELLKFAEECRVLNIQTLKREDVSAILLKMNKYVNMGMFTENAFHHGLMFTYWRSTPKYAEEVYIINDFYNNQLPAQIEEFVRGYRPLLEKKDSIVVNTILESEIIQKRKTKLKEMTTRDEQVFDIFNRHVLDCIRPAWLADTSGLPLSLLEEKHKEGKLYKLDDSPVWYVYKIFDALVKIAQQVRTIRTPEGDNEKLFDFMLNIDKYYMNMTALMERNHKRSDRKSIHVFGPQERDYYLSNYDYIFSYYTRIEVSSFVFILANYIREKHYIQDDR